MEIGNYIKQELEKNPIDPPKSGWKNIAENPQLCRFNQKMRIKRWALCGGVALFVMFVGVVAALGILQLKQQNFETKVVQEHKNQQNAQCEYVPIEDVIVIPSEKQQIVGKQTATKQVVKVKDTLPQSKKEKVLCHSYEDQESVVITSLQKKCETENSFVAPSISSSSEPIAAIQELPEKNLLISEDNLEIEEISSSENTYLDPDFEQMEENVEPSAFQLFIPNAFTPNGDGLNDLFLVQTEQDLLDFEMIISDRRGRILFRTKDVQQGWNGEFKGQSLPQGTYMYLVIYNYKGTRQMQKGAINLIR